MGKGPTDEWLTWQEVADEVKLPIRTLYAKRHRGEGPKAYRLGRGLRVRRRDLEAWIEQHADPVRPAA